MAGEKITVFGYKKTDFDKSNVVISFYDKEIAENVRDHLRDLSRAKLINEEFKPAEEFLIAANKLEKEIDRVFPDIQEM